MFGEIRKKGEKVVVSRLDISPTDGLDLDERFALEHFLGKNQEEAAALLSLDFSYYMEDLSHMGEKAFLYYLGAVRLYLERGEEKFAPSDYVEVAHTLLYVFQGRTESSPSWLQNANDDVSWIVSFIVSRLQKIIQDDESWVVDDMLISDKKIRSIIRRWCRFSV